MKIDRNEKKFSPVYLGDDLYLIQGRHCGKTGNSDRHAMFLGEVNQSRIREKRSLIAMGGIEAVSTSAALGMVSNIESIETFAPPIVSVIALVFGIATLGMLIGCPFLFMAFKDYFNEAKFRRVKPTLLTEIDLRGIADDPEAIELLSDVVDIRRRLQESSRLAKETRDVLKDLENHESDDPSDQMVMSDVEVSVESLDDLNNELISDLELRVNHINNLSAFRKVQEVSEKVSELRHGGGSSSI